MRGLGNPSWASFRYADFAELGLENGGPDSEFSAGMASYKLGVVRKFQVVTAIGPLHTRSRSYDLRRETQAQRDS
jgi:hypothetical protein